MNPFIYQKIYLEGLLAAYQDIKASYFEPDCVDRLDQHYYTCNVAQQIASRRNPLIKVGHANLIMDRYGVKWTESRGLTTGWSAFLNAEAEDFINLRDRTIGPEHPDYSVFITKLTQLREEWIDWVIARLSEDLARIGGDA